PSGPLLFINDPVQQHLMMTGRTLFKGMKFADLRRMQIDIETYTSASYEFSNPEREGDRILIITLADSTGWTEMLSATDLGEKEMLEKFVASVRERDPDVLEGHNFFNFDFPYIMTRARRHKVKLSLGRDGSLPSKRPSRYIMADRTVAYTRVEIMGRHLVDTYFLALAYDVSHRSLEGHGLKDVARHFGVAAAHRTYIDGDQIARQFDKDPQAVMAYAKDDILETRSISAILSPSYFLQAQLLPFSYQNVCVRGNGTKIDSLMLREYLRQRHAIAAPGIARSFEGGYTDLFLTGLFQNVHHCDVRSLYPSVILKDRLAPRHDDLGVFLSLLEHLKQFRLDAKARMQASRSDEERQHFEALQSTFKVLINSFYGYLGFEQGRFSDYTMAEKVAATGRTILKGMLDAIGKLGGKPVEIDTDGIYYIPPPFSTAADADRFQSAFRDTLPEGIEVEFDDPFPSMFSYKMKNYALLDAQGEIIIKGAALKSRGLEPFQRRFLREWLKRTLEGNQRTIPELYQSYRDSIQLRQWPIGMLAKSETLQDAPATYLAKIKDKGRGRNAAYELALRSGRDYRAGDQVSYYVTGNAKSVSVHDHSKLVTDWDPGQRDENVPYYLAKLDALLHKFDTEEDTPSENADMEFNFDGPVSKEDAHE
ncbi:MAG: DNA polymerase domain-containing protein, partial [Lentisphaerota bacterium]